MSIWKYGILTFLFFISAYAYSQKSSSDTLEIAIKPRLYVSYNKKDLFCSTFSQLEEYIKTNSASLTQSVVHLICYPDQANGYQTLNNVNAMLKNNNIIVALFTAYTE
jgi:hypothetical protein